MESYRNNCVDINFGIGTLKIFKPAHRFQKLELKYNSLKQVQRYEYTPWVLHDEIFISRNKRLSTSPLIKYEYINSYTKIKDDTPIDIINQYNVYKREFIKLDGYKEKIMKKVA